MSLFFSLFERALDLALFCFFGWLLLVTLENNGIDVPFFNGAATYGEVIQSGAVAAGEAGRSVTGGTSYLDAMYPDGYAVTWAELHGLDGWKGIDVQGGCNADTYSPVSGVVTYNARDGYVGKYDTKSEQNTMLTIETSSGESITWLHGRYTLPVGTVVAVGDHIGYEDEIGNTTGANPCHSHIIYRTGNGATANILNATVKGTETVTAVSNGITGGSVVDPQLSGSGVARWEQNIQAAAAKHNIDPDLLRGIVTVESNGDPHAVSESGAVGLTQIIPPTKSDHCPTYDLTDPDMSLDCSAKILNWMNNYLQADRSTLIMAYHGGAFAIKNGNIRAIDREYLRRVTAAGGLN